MFQYAAGSALSLSRGVPLLLDVDDFSRHRWHNGFELERIFSFPVTLATPEDINIILGWQSWKSLRHRLARPAWRLLRSHHFVAEPHFHYWPGIRHAVAPCYLLGYWQSERYFVDRAQTIRANFTFRHPLSDRNSDLARKINAVNSVSLHIRRGDYVTNPQIAISHGVCPQSYYKAAIEYIREHVDGPHFFVFSDDPDWVKAELSLQGRFCLVDHNRGAESYNDMRLMSMCRHHIIANSTFSWWGAWLNPSPTKIVIAPRLWFNNHAADARDLFPEGWITL